MKHLNDSQSSFRNEAGADVVEELRRTFTETLGNLIRPGERCALVGFPDHPNVGDSAIWLGERAFLTRHRARVVYTCAQWYSPAGLQSRVRNGKILIHGGGNLGDLWAEHQEFREKIIRDFPDNSIIQLPQSIHFNDRRNLARARAVFDGHADLTILVRDQRSLDIARNEFRARSLVCPDAAFALGALHRRLAPERDCVWLLRTDTESIEHGPVPVTSNDTLVDWLEDRDSAYLRLNRQLKRYGQPPRASYAPFVRLLQGRAWEGLARERVRRGCEMLSRGQVVITDRLHGHILSLLLGIHHIFLDNNYGKLTSFYETWTRESNLTHWARSINEAAALTSDLRGRLRRS